MRTAFWLALGLLALGCKGKLHIAGSDGTGTGSGSGSSTSTSNGSGGSGSSASGTSQGTAGGTSASTGAGTGTAGGTGTTGTLDPCAMGPFTVSYADPVTISAGANPQGVTLADVDKDGNLDLVNTSRDEQTILTHMGNGDGTFKVPVDSPIMGPQPSPTRIHVAPIGDDGVADAMYIADALPTRGFQIRRGNGDGTWGFTDTYTDNPAAIRLVDMNEDGIRDALYLSAMTLGVRLGDVMESFGSPTTRDVGGTAKAVALGDIDGDGHLDVATANFGNINVYTGDGQVNFTFSASLNLPGGIGGDGSIAMGDMTGDGAMDLVAVTLGGGTDGAYLFPGDGDGKFGPSTKFAVQQAPLEVVAADIDRDGTDDIGVIHTGGQMVVRLADGNGGFGDSMVKTCGSNLRQVVAGDLNGDCVLDLVAAAPTDDALCVMLSQ